MTPEQFLTRMQVIENELGHDIEAVHARMDELMCDVLSSLGYGAGVGVFVAQRKWYS